jgi:DNA-binding NtrC family response regulator
MPVFIDLSRGATAVQRVRDVRARVPAAQVFAVADPKRPRLTTDAVLAGVADVFAQPLSGRSVTIAIARETDRPPRQASIPPDLYVRSQAMSGLMTIVRLASTMRAGVLIRGEEGSGRQFLARSIHASQNGRGGPFVALDCAAHPDALDHLLFGSPASNGLACVSPGSSLYQARSGTLYFRHIAEMPGRVQARLARVLRDGEAVLSGSGAAIGLDVRPIAAVDSGFDRSVDLCRVRDDLFRMLFVIGIDMPPLRHRREDIPAIARGFLRKICEIKQLPPKVLSRSALALVAALPWHGNAIELRAFLEGVCDTSEAGRTIALPDVLARLRLDTGSSISNGETLKEARARFEREYIATAL